MARVAIPLNDKRIKDSKPKDKDYTLSDGRGLQLLIKKDGTKLWEFYYLRQSTQKRAKTSFGVYPSVSLANARLKRTEYLNLINSNTDPIEFYKNEKLKAKENNMKEKNTIKLIAERFFLREIETKKISSVHQVKEGNRIKNHFIIHLPKKDDTLIDDITFEISIKILKKLEKINKLETLFRVKMILVRILKYAYSENIISSAELYGKIELYSFKARAKSEVRNNPTYTSKEDIQKLYNDILSYKNIYTKYLMLLSIHTAQRQGTLIKAKWCNIDFCNKIWNIDKEDMKNKQNHHTVPLSDVMIGYLKELYSFTGDNQYLFPNSQVTAKRNKYPHASNNTVTKAFRIMGHPKDKQTAHGLRAMFKTVCKEHQESHNIKNEFVEKILAHKVGGNVEELYNRANNIKDMLMILNWWSNYLESLISQR